MHVLILNQTFYPDVAATAQLMWDLARHLGEHGHRVTAISSRTIYGSDQQFEKAYEKIGPIEIHRVQGTRFGKKHLPGRLCDFGTYYLAAAAQMQAMAPPDVILALTTPPKIATLAMIQKQFRRRPDGERIRFVYHIMDLYPDAATAMGVMPAGSFIECGVARLTQRTLDLADAVIVLGRDMKERIVGRYRCDAERIHVVQPWADGKLLFPMRKSDNPMARRLGCENTFNIVYSGNLGLAHDLDTLIGAIELTRSDPTLRWIFIGDGQRFASLREASARSGWKHVDILPFQSRAELNESLNLADVHLVSQLPEFTGIVVPSKLFGMLAVGKPSIMVGPPDAECARIIAESGAGFVVSNGSGALLVERIRRFQSDPALLEQTGRRARAEFERNYEERVACSRIETILAREAGE